MTLITRPDKYPEWASVDQNDPILPVPNVVEPPTAKKHSGWFFKEPPPANWFNWLLRYIYRWITFFDDQSTNVNPVFGIDTSITPNIITVTLAPPLTQYTDGRLFIIKINNTSTGTVTLSINGLPAKQVVDLDETVLVGGEVLANGMYMFVYSLSADKFFLQSKPDASSGSTGDAKYSSNKNQSGWLAFENDSWTIGKASTAAHFNTDSAKDLFIHWYATYSNAICPVSGGRTGNALNDWNAGKTMRIYPICGQVLGVVGQGAGLTNRPLGTYAGEEKHPPIIEETASHGHLVEGIAVGSWEHRKNGDDGTEFIKGGNRETDGAGGNQTFNVMQPTAFVLYFMVKL
jgi:hypothetical protein